MFTPAYWRGYTRGYRMAQRGDAPIALLYLAEMHGDDYADGYSDGHFDGMPA